MSLREYLKVAAGEAADPVASMCDVMLADLKWLVNLIEKVRAMPPGMDRVQTWDTETMGNTHVKRVSYTGWVFMLGLDELGLLLEEERQQVEQEPTVTADGDEYPF